MRQTSTKKKFIINMICMLFITTAFAGSAAADWPMFQQNPAHTGVATSSAPANNDVLWTYDIGSYIASSPVIVNERVYVGAHDMKLHCFDAMGNDDGTTIELWNFSVGSVISTTPAVVNDRVYFASVIEKTLYCIDAVGNGDGTTDLIWSYSTDGFISTSSPVVVNDQVYFGDWTGTIYCLDAIGNGNGETEKIWSYQTDGAIWGPPAIYNGKVYVGSKDDALYCLDAEGNQDGTTDVLWEYETGADITGSATIVDNKVYIGSDGGLLYCLDAEGNGDGTTELIWSYQTGSAISSTPAVNNDRVYVTSEDWKVYCFDADGNGDGTTTVLWSFHTGGSVLSSPALGDNMVYARSQDGVLYCLDALGNGDQTTSLIWTFETGASSSSPAIDLGNIYIGSESGMFYALYSEPLAAPEGPSLAMVGETVEFTVADENDQGDEIQYFIDFGDGSNSYWIPERGSPSGEEFTVTHSYKDYGDYEVRVKTRPAGSTLPGGPWSEPHNIHIHALSINSISGGFGLSLTVTNHANVGKDVHYNIDLVGGSLPVFHLNKHYDGAVTPLKRNQTATIQTPMLFGLGNFDITITLSCSGETDIVRTLDGKILLFYVILT